MSATPYDERHSIEVHVLAQQLKVNRSIGVAIEYEAPCVSTLCHMMRDIHCHHSVKSPMMETITAAIPRCPNLFQVEKTLMLSQRLLRQSSSPVWRM